ncbi:hypothetical protein ARMSODRAFT_737417 [Armillaria solidipes]|uniref:Uncharacterized protein n=1 Tax=Armillaria solidipes TaxID=1076256 RepID=A0A2H3AR24_9AGAR|nr:hypothetical protein ARMSODRAFT_737417 [Armillaria solidipes]
MRTLLLQHTPDNLSPEQNINYWWGQSTSNIYLGSPAKIYWTGNLSAPSIPTRDGGSQSVSIVVKSSHSVLSPLYRQDPSALPTGYRLQIPHGPTRSHRVRYRPIRCQGFISLPVASSFCLKHFSPQQNLPSRRVHCIRTLFSRSSFYSPKDWTS